jgi:hypothetical protein
MAWMTRGSRITAFDYVWARLAGRLSGLALHVLDEVIHHGAEIGLLRDLYAHRASRLGRAP